MELEEFSEIMKETTEILIELQVSLLCYELIKSLELVKIAKGNIAFIEAEDFFNKHNKTKESFNVLKSEIEKIENNLYKVMQ